MTYCISDIHGEIDRFRAMLKIIQLAPEDQLYILGDVIDRGSAGIDIIQIIMRMKNVKMLLGNHEQMMYDDLGETYTYNAKRLWLSNGGSPTRRRLLYCTPAQERRAVLKFIKGLPDMEEINVNGKPFVLVHGMPSCDKQNRIWGRIDESCENPVPGKTVVVGHTPTCFLTNNFSEPFRIWKRPGIIDIDCGCGNATEFRALACLRLDDMKEFYV